MSETGQVIVPKEAREQLGLGMGSPLEFIQSEQGDLIFRPMASAHKMDLIDHLTRFKGLELPERAHHCPPRV
jgi:AbrB family looped-hinge helix DNA binding protein